MTHQLKMTGVRKTYATGAVKVDAETLRTSHPRIWAGGDVAHGRRAL